VLLGESGTLLACRMIKVDIETPAGRTLLKITLGSYPVVDATHPLIPPEVSSLVSCPMFFSPP
jgi:hypothetical protein